MQLGISPQLPGAAPKSQSYGYNRATRYGAGPFLLAPGSWILGHMRHLNKTVAVCIKTSRAFFGPGSGSMGIRPETSG